MSLYRLEPRHPVYRWECMDDDCGEFEAPEVDLRMVRRHARGHAEDSGHNVIVLRVVEWHEWPEATS